MTTLPARLTALERNLQPSGDRWLEVFTPTDADIAAAAAAQQISPGDLRRRMQDIEAAINRARAFFHRGMWSAQVIRTALLGYLRPAMGFEATEDFLRGLEAAGAPIIWDRV